MPGEGWGIGPGRSGALFSLRTKIALTFAGVVLVPLVVASLGLRELVLREAEVRVGSELDAMASSALAGLGKEALFVGRAVESVGKEASSRPELLEAAARGDSGPMAGFLREASSGWRLDFVGLFGPEGSLLAWEGRSGEWFGGPPRPREVLERADSPAVKAVARLESGGKQVGVIVGGLWLDGARARELSHAEVEVAFATGGRVISGSDPGAEDLPAASAGPVRVDVPRGPWLVKGVEVSPGGPRLLVFENVGFIQERGRRLLLLLALLFVVAGGLSGALAAVLAGAITAPIRLLTQKATALAAGEFVQKLDVRSRDEVGELARVFSEMSRRIHSYVRALEDSREELRRSLVRMGAALASGTDLETAFAAVVEAALTALGAKVGAVYLRSAGGDFVAAAARGLPAEVMARAKVRVGEGLAGLALASRRCVRAPEDGRVGPGEPEVETGMAVPLVGRGEVLGCLAVYDRPGGFDAEDVETLEAFAAQASRAMEDALLQMEVERLSITDEMTGLWNYRYFRMALAREVERASRFSHPFSLLIVDIDHFKEVNDAHGHLKGDEVLKEVASRLLLSVRSQVDTVARYGGDEFSIILPETDLRGARVVAEKVRRRVGGEPVIVNGAALRVTVSVGVASYPMHGIGAGALLAAADRALYRAKQVGRDQVAVPG